MAEGKASEKRKTNIFDAIKSGQHASFELLVESDGEDALRHVDEQGFTAAHWACLGGHTAILRRIAEAGGPLDNPATSDESPASRPVHWACVNGHVAVVDVLLQHGVSIDIADAKGCTPLIVAAQYGHATLAGYLMGKGARLLIADKEGDTALHWAAFKGHSAVMRLLIYSGFNPKQKDNYGQSALHLACINGSLTAVKELCEQDDVEIDVPDKNGRTPLALATGRKHADVVSYLKKRSQHNQSFLSKLDIWSIIFGPPGNAKGPLLFFMVAVLLYGYPIYLYKMLYTTWADLYLLHIVFWLVNVIMWVCLYHSSTIDPGYLPRNVPEYDLAIKQVAQYDEWRHGDDNPLARLCHTCRTVKPARSKHCRVCRRCVMHFDHHCPYIYNCVGYNNRIWFAGFVISLCIGGALASIFLYALYTAFDADILITFSCALAAFCEGMSLLMMCTLVFHMLINVTTNERQNMDRYKHLKDSNGNFQNPFHRGYKGNILEYFHIIPPQIGEQLQHVKIV